MHFVIQLVFEMLDQWFVLIQTHIVILNWAFSYNRGFYSIKAWQLHFSQIVKLTHLFAVINMVMFQIGIIIPFTGANYWLSLHTRAHNS